MFGLAVEIMNICGSALTDLRILIFMSTIHEKIWTNLSDGMKLKYTKDCIKNGH
jgi:hypothetical protein